MNNLVNNIYSSWTVIAEGPIVTNKARKQWLCRCKCGLEKLVYEANLINGKSKNCINCRPNGCITHGLSNHRLYSTWKSMRTRCNNPNSLHFKHYGGKDIKVCKEWDDFQVFLDDMESTFVEGLTLDRKENNKDYCKSNCRWATDIEQATNQTKSLKLEFKGKVITEAELSRLTGVSRTTIQTRRNKGASVEEMIYGFK